MHLSAISLCLFIFVLYGCLLSSTAGLEIEVIILENVSCFGGNDGMAMVNVTDSEGTLRYLWSTNDNTAVSQRLNAGLHNVSVKDANTIVTKSFLMLEPSRLAGGPYTYHTPAATCSGQSHQPQQLNQQGQVSAQAHGGTPPYNYIWVASSIDVEFTVLSASSPTIIFDEMLSSYFTLLDGSGRVSLQSASVPAYSGLWSIRVEATNAAKFSVMCSINSPSCIASDQHRGIEFWLWKEDAQGSITVGLVDQNGVIVEAGITQFGFTAQTWTMAFLDFKDIPSFAYGGLYFATDGAFTFHLDDIAILPKEDNFIAINGSEESLQIGTPSAIRGPAGEYSLRIIDNNECPLLLNMAIANTPGLHSSASVDETTVTLHTRGGTPPYIYEMTDGHNVTVERNNDGVFSDISPGNYTVEVVDAGGCVDSIQVSVTGKHVIPNPPSGKPGTESFSRYKVVNSLLGILAGVCAVATILLSYLVHKRKGDLRPHSLLFCQTILIGAFLGYIAAILAVIDVSWARCIAFAWAVDFSVTIIYGSMFAKSMQILKILDNFTKFVSIDTTDRYMAKVFCFIIVPELMLLAIWTCLTGTWFHATITAGKAEVIFWIIFLVYKSIVGFIASFVCFRMRYKFKEYLEIQQIAYCHFTLEVLLVFLLVFTLIARESYTELFVGVQSFAVSAIVSIPLLVIISPILRRALKEYREEKKTKKWHKLTMYT